MSPYLMVKKRSSSSFLIKSLIFIIFWLVAILVVIYIMGYEVDWKKLRIEETGTIYLASSLGRLKADIDLNDRFESKELPTSFSRLKSGYYSIMIEKEGYIDWQKNLEVQASKVTAEDFIILFKENPEIREANDNERSFLNTQSIEFLDSTIRINQNELYANDRLVTRFSADITYATWYPDGNHLIYQMKNQIGIIEADGANNTHLITLNSTDPIKYRFLRKGQDLLYQNQDKILVARLYDY